MKKQIRLEKWMSTKDANGDNKESVTKYNLWADVTDISGARATMDGQSLLKNLMKFKIYFRPDFDLSGNWKIVFNGSKFSIQNISPVNMERFYWEIIAQKIDKN